VRGGQAPEARDRSSGRRPTGQTGECLDSGRSRAAIDADIGEGTRLGVSGTPTFFVNGRPLVGNLPLAVFQRAIERELAQSAPRK
jgi:protein-disulfide isomerase